MQEETTEDMEKMAAVFLGGASCAARAVNESADAAHFKDFVLFGWGDVFQYFGHQFGSHAVFYGLPDAEGVGDGWFADAYFIAGLD